MEKLGKLSEQNETALSESSNNFLTSPNSRRFRHL